METTESPELLGAFLARLRPAPRHPKDDWKFPASYLCVGDLAPGDLTVLRQLVGGLDEAAWREAELTTQLSEYLNTVILLHHAQRHRLWPAIEPALAPLLALLERFYGGGAPVLVCLDRLRAGVTIPAHRDGPCSQPPFPDVLPSFYRRTHVAVVTDPAVEFVVDGERRHLGAGEVWEINNWRVHHVDNRAAVDRVHLLVDWDAPPHSRRGAPVAS